MYVKKYDEQGKLLNPITKEQPFLNKSVKVKQPKQRRVSKLIFDKKSKYLVWYQRIGNKLIEHCDLLKN